MDPRDLNESDIRENNKFDLIRDIVKVNLERTYNNSKKRYDLRSRPINYNIGDVVWKLNKKQSDAAKGLSAKLYRKYVKCRVIRKVGSNSYELVDENGKGAGIVSTKLLKS